MFIFEAVLILTLAGWVVGGLEVIIKLTQFNCYCNCQLELSLTKLSEESFVSKICFCDQPCLTSSQFSSELQVWETAVTPV